MRKPMRHARAVMKLMWLHYIGHAHHHHGCGFHCGKVEDEQSCPCQHRRRMAMFAMGVLVMHIGALVASCAPDHGILHVCIDTLGYFIHGFGAIPFLKIGEELLHL